jgi:2-polyprenyl-3-methyl-5-hydroxy-6-metoxy-1,4-benzoquinol methylase
VLTDDEIALAWRYILGREPESATIYEAHREHGDLETLRRILFDSDEFRAKYTHYTKSVNRLRFATNPAARARVDESTLAALLARTRQQWVALGESEPYWSVMTADRYRMNAIDGSRGEFFAAGERAWHGAKATLARNGIEVGADTVCVDFGCGVGRVAVHVAPMVGALHGYDISPGNLEMAKQNAAARGLRNAGFHLLRDLDDFDRIEPYDLLFSTIVLQHNSPPVQRAMLERLARRAKPGGVMCFQLATYAAQYRFEVQAYLATPRAVMDMHVLPQADVFEVMQASGFAVLEVMEDNAIAHPEWLSTMFLARKAS